MHKPIGILVKVVLTASVTLASAIASESVAPIYLHCTPALESCHHMQVVPLRGGITIDKFGAAACDAGDNNFLLGRESDIEVTAASFYIDPLKFSRGKNTTAGPVVSSGSVDISRADGSYKASRIVDIINPDNTVNVHDAWMQEGTCVKIDKPVAPTAPKTVF
jgi:hypothetical protein